MRHGFDMTTGSRKISGQSLKLGHGIAIVCAICGLALIIVAPLDSVVYGIVLLSIGIGIDIIVAVQCSGHQLTYRRGFSSRRSRVLNPRKRAPARR